MKKKLAGLLVTAVMLCGCLGLSAMAAGIIVLGKFGL